MLKAPPASWKLADHEGPLVVNTEHFSVRSKWSFHLWNLMSEQHRPFRITRVTIPSKFVSMSFKLPWYTTMLFILIIVLFLLLLLVVWIECIMDWLPTGSARLHCFFFSSVHLFLPAWSDSGRMEKGGPIQEVDFGNKSIQTNPGVRRVSCESVLAT